MVPTSKTNGKLPPKRKLPTVPLESVWRPKDTGFVPLTIIDFRVHLHFILGKVAEYSQAVDFGLPPKGDSERWLEWELALLATEEFAVWLRAAWTQRLMRGPDMLPQTSHRVVVVDDARGERGYWRNLELTSYKGDRSSVRSPMYAAVKDAGYAQMIRYELPVFSKKLFEADDWAGAVYRLKLHACKVAPDSCLAQRELFYSTVDGDWMQLVDDASRQYWANTGPWVSRLKNEAETRSYVRKKLGVAIKHPNEIARAKHIAGDLGDCLPAGSPIELFELTTAHHEHFLEGSEEWLELESELASSDSNCNFDALRNSIAYCVQKCLPICIGRG